MEIPNLRIGLGHDTHRLGSTKPLIVGGVTVPHHQGLIGHSDADVLLHAISDALLGACGLGDIGEWFPDTDPQWAGADSARLLESIKGEIKNRGWQIANLDCTIHAERPKLSPFKQAIRTRIAEILEIDPACVNVKAKTGEQVGPIGRQEAISADAIVLLIRNPS
ncbi:MAG: 2-C-methyl-D-erythritol 2,4-cyclodiphosphate synthase [Planctomycetaceae bacterium]